MNGRTKSQALLSTFMNIGRASGAYSPLATVSELGVTYGYVYQNKLYLPPKSDTPLLDFLVQYIGVCFASGLKSVVDIYTALFSPNSLSASSAFNVLLE